MKLFVTEAQAVRAGMTHHGKLFGIPAWMAETPEGVDAVPKFRPFSLWCAFADWAYDFAATMMPSGSWVEAPMRVTAPIDMAAYQNHEMHPEDEK